MARGRAKGRETKGYWFRTNRGWYVTFNGQAIPLCGSDGNHIKDPEAKTKVREAYRIWTQTTTQLARNSEDPTVIDICRAYLESIKDGTPSTYAMRRRFLFDLCFGVSFKYREDADKCPPSERIHKGFGKLRASEMTPAVLDQWLVAHPAWKGSRRSALQAVRRAFNYAKEARLIQDSTIRNLKVGKTGCRRAYWNQAEEAAIMQCLPEYVREALYSCLRTGCRPGELAALESRHVVEESDGQKWVGMKSKKDYTGEEREVFVIGEIAEIVRRRQKLYPTGPLFRRKGGKPWTQASMQNVFRKLRPRLAKLGVRLTRDKSCWYCARHTFAKRILGGEWGQPPQTIEIIAGLMGNTPKVCWEHYAKWISDYSAPKRRALGN